MDREEFSNSIINPDPFVDRFDILESEKLVTN